MTLNETLDILKGLKLNGMAESYNEMMNLPINMRPSLEQAMSRMIEAEKCHRSNALTAKLLKASHLRYTAYMEDIECSTARNLTRAMLDEIADCRFIRNGENLLITGLTGCGESYLACAIGRQACMLGLRTEYMNMNHFVDTIAQSRMDGTFQKLLKRLDRNDLIIFDDFGLVAMNADTRIALLQILEDRYEKKSVIIASQLPVDKWYDYIAEATLADAIMDRLVNSSNLIKLEGPSMRQRRKR